MQKCRPLLILFFMALLFYDNAYVQAQSLASMEERKNLFPNPDQGKQQEQTLASIISELESRFKVNISYDFEVVNDKFVKSPFSFKNELDENLSSLLKPFKLRFKKLEQGYYVIQSDEKKEEVEKLKLKSATSNTGESANNPLGFNHSSSLPSVGTTLPIAQDKTISGKVTDENDEGLPGVNIVVKETTTGTVTDVDGNYRLTVSDDASVLVFSSVGYIAEEINIGNQTVINVSLVPDIKALDEILVIGYGTAKKANLTNAVANIKADTWEDRPLTTLSEAFSGQIAGVYAQQSSGLPGKDFSINVRGINTITSGTGPLYVVDGMPVSDMTDFNMNDVASIEVLKDASSAAIYGARGAGGVVLITTKKAKPGDIRINFEGYTGVQVVSDKIELMNGPQFMEMTEWATKEKYRRDGMGDPFADPSITIASMDPSYWVRPFWYDGRDYLISDTDWQEEGLKPAVKNSAQLTVSRGMENGGFMASINYLNQDGLFQGTGFERYSFRSNGNYKFNDKLEVGLNLAATYSLADGFTNGEDKESPYMRLLAADPTVPVDANYRSHPEGFLSFDPNPLLQSIRILDDTKTKRTLGTVFLNWEVLDGLVAGVRYGLDMRNVEATYFKPQDVNKRERREGRASDMNSFRSLVQATLNYDKSFGKHSFNALLGTSLEQFDQKSIGFESWDFPNDDIHTLNTAASLRGWDDYESEWALYSVFGRLGYNFSDRYIASFSLRRDGSSRFGEDAKYGVFPSASVAWRVSEESFFQPVKFMSELKVRASWGQVGNDNIGNYSSFGRLGTANYAFDGDLAYGFAPRSPDNPTLTWETTTTYDFGLDMGFLENRISMSLDYYINKTEDLLLDVPTPALTGFPGSLTQNSGSVENRGIELEITSTNIRSNKLGGIRWETSFNLAHNQNEVLSLGPGIEEIIGVMAGSPTHMTRPGLPIRSYYLYENIGILTEADIADENVAKANNQEAGNAKIRDTNNDGVIDDDDRVVLSNNHPSLIFGVLNRVEVGDFDLSVLFNGVTGFDTYFFLGRYLDVGGHFARNQMVNQVNAYHSAEDPGDGKTPYPFGVNPNYDDRWLYNGNYYRIKNVTLGYTLPVEMLSRLKVNSFRVYVSIDNLLNITDYPGGNPESNSFQTSDNYTQGADYGTYPLTRTYSLGVKVGF